MLLTCTCGKRLKAVPPARRIEAPHQYGRSIVSYCLFPNVGAFHWRCASGAGESDKARRAMLVAVTLGVLFPLVFLAALCAEPRPWASLYTNDSRIIEVRVCGGGG
jgi:hypothetical protein